MTIFFVCPREGAGRREGRACRQGVGTGFPPHSPTLWSSSRGHPPAPPASYKRDFSCPFTSSVFPPCCNKYEAGSAHAEAMAGSGAELSNATGVLMEGRSPPEPAPSQAPLNNDGQGEPSPDPQGQRSPRAGTEAFLSALRRGARFLVPGWRGGRTPPRPPAHLAVGAGQFLARQWEAELQPERRGSRPGFPYAAPAVSETVTGAEKEGREHGPKRRVGTLASQA